MLPTHGVPCPNCGKHDAQGDYMKCPHCAKRVPMARMTVGNAEAWRPAKDPSS